MAKSALVILLCTVLGALWALPVPAAEQVNIEEGKSRVLKFDFVVQKIATGDPSICAGVRTGDQEVLINAQSVGKTNVIIFGPGSIKREILINVTSRNVAATAEELRAIFGDIEGVQVRPVGSRIIVEGQVLSKRSMEKIETVIGEMPNVVNLVEFSPVMKRIVKEEIVTALKAEGFKKVTVNAGKNKFILGGTVASEGSSKRAEAVARAFSPDVVNAIQVITPARKRRAQVELIEMGMQIMEMDKNVLKELGFQWNPGGSLSASGNYQGQTGSSPTLSGALAGTISNLFPKMRRVQERGQGRSLMQQNLVTKSGGTATFFMGSEVPIPVAQEGGTMSVEYKKVGMTLNFTPTIGSGTHITSPIKIENSSITGTGANQMPIISNTQLETIVRVKSGHSIALAGLVSQRDFQSGGSVPPASAGTALFQANKGSRKGAGTREVVIFVTPTILKDPQEAVKKAKRKVESSFKEQELEVLRKQYQKKN